MTSRQCRSTQVSEPEPPAHRSALSNLRCLAYIIFERPDGHYGSIIDHAFHQSFLRVVSLRHPRTRDTQRVVDTLLFRRLAGRRKSALDPHMSLDVLMLPGVAEWELTALYTSEGVLQPERYLFSTHSGCLHSSLHFPKTQSEVHIPP